MSPLRDFAEMVWTLKSKSPELFHSLVKMHLSFCIEHQLDDVDVIDTQKSQNDRHPLSCHGRKTKTTSKVLKSDAELLPLLHELIDFLNNAEHLVQEGIFRKSGKFKQQQELQNLIFSPETGVADIGEILRSGTYTVHEVSTVLKNILAETSEPLVTDAYYGLHCSIAQLNQKSRQLRSLQLLFLLLPKENYELLRELLILLNQIASHSDKNKMNSLNLGTMLAPHVLCPRKISPEELTINAGVLAHATSFMIDRALELFQLPVEFINDVRLHSEAEKKREEDVCSTASTPPIKTSITFVDREMTAKLVANGDPTEVALAELYAFVQSQPESEVKKKWVHKFNKENGCGTPKIVQNCSFVHDSCQKAGKNLAHSIKKHLFKTTSSNTSTTPRRRRSKSASRPNNPPYYTNAPSPVIEDEVRTPRLRSFRAHSESRRTLCSVSTDACLPTPTSDFIRHPAYARHTSRRLSDISQQQISPLTQSTNNLPPNIRETMMTPRSRRPVFTFSPIDEPNDVIIDQSCIKISSPEEKENSDVMIANDRSMKTSTPGESAAINNVLEESCIKMSTPEEKQADDVITEYGFDKNSISAEKATESEETGLTEAFKNYLLLRDIQVWDLDGDETDLLAMTDSLSESLREILDGEIPEEKNRLAGSPTLQQPLPKSIVFETSL